MNGVGVKGGSLKRERERYIYILKLSTLTDCCRPCLPRLMTPSQIRDGDSFIANLGTFAELKLQEYESIFFNNVRMFAREYWTIYQTVRPKQEPSKRSVSNK